MRVSAPKKPWFAALVAVMAVLVATLVLAADLPRMPGELQLKPSSGSPGQVTFNHLTHVDADRPDCTVCHPKLFPILKKTPAAGRAILHAKMDKGQQCGACHNGKKAFGRDDCAGCHR